MKTEKSKTKIVYWKDGSYLIVEDGNTWEFENDTDWLKTIPLLDVIAGYEQSLKLIGELKEKLAFVVTNLDDRLDEKYESDDRLGSILDDIKAIYL